MNNLKFDKYSDTQFNSCVELIKSTWNFHLDFINISDENVVYECYLKTCLNWNQHLDVILDENSNVKGVLFGSKENSSIIKELLFSRKERQINKWKNQQLNIGAFGERKKKRNNYLPILSLMINKVRKTQSYLIVRLIYS